MRPSFAVKVRYKGKPLAGVGVEVTSYSSGEGKIEFTGSTSRDGMIRVAKLPAGEYWLHTEFLDIPAGSGCFHVSDQASRKAKRKVVYDWGDYPESTRRIAGKLIESQPGKGDSPLMNMAHRIETPKNFVTLKLQNPITGNTYSTASDRDGRFAFDTIPEGAYVLHVLDARILLALNPTSHRTGLKLVWKPASGGSCGGVIVEDASD